MIGQVKEAVKKYNEVAGEDIKFVELDNELRFQGKIVPFFVNGYGINDKYRELDEVTVSETSFKSLPEAEATSELNRLLSIINEAADFQLNRDAYRDKSLVRGVLQYEHYVEVYNRSRVSAITDPEMLDTIATIDGAFTALKALFDFVQENIMKLKIGATISVRDEDNIANRRLVHELAKLILECSDRHVPEIMDTLDESIANNQQLN